jgi:hypothetical protein
MGGRLPVYEVWGSNIVTEWTQCVLETDDEAAARLRADAIIANGQFRFAAIDRDCKTIWSNDPDTPAEVD